MSEIECSIHKDVKKMDTPGHAKADKFWYTGHTQMSDTISLEMHCNHYIRAPGEVSISCVYLSHSLASMR